MTPKDINLMDLRDINSEKIAVKLFYFIEKPLIYVLIQLIQIRNILTRRIEEERLIA